MLMGTTGSLPGLCNDESGGGILKERRRTDRILSIGNCGTTGGRVPSVDIVQGFVIRISDIRLLPGLPFAHSEIDSAAERAGKDLRVSGSCGSPIPSGRVNSIVHECLGHRQSLVQA
jgi:hypothetical protein